MKTQMGFRTLSSILSTLWYRASTTRPWWPCSPTALPSWAWYWRMYDLGSQTQHLTYLLDSLDPSSLLFGAAGFSTALLTLPSEWQRHWWQPSSRGTGCTSNSETGQRYASLVKPLRLSDTPKHSYRASHCQTDPTTSFNGHHRTASHSREVTYLFTIMDRFTRWQEVIPFSDTFPTSCVRAIITNWITRFGVPVHISSDRGVQFTSDLWSTIAQLFGVKLHHP